MLISAKEIINKSLELFRRDIRIWISYLVVSVVSALLGLIFAFNPTVLLFFSTLGISSFVVLMVCMLFLLGITVFNIWFNIALVRTIHKRLFNQPALTMKQEFAEVKHLLPRTIGISFVVALIVFLPLGISIVGATFTGFEDILLGNFKGVTLLYLFFGLLGIYGIFHLIYFSLKYVFSYYLVTLEEKQIRESLHQGQALVKERMGEIFWRLFAPLVLFLLMYVFANYIFTALSDYIGGMVISIFANFLSLIVSAFVALLSVIALVILFEDAKTKAVGTSVKKG